ncbi:MAG: hypothetical protein D6769_01440 [Methanobacteriota archaeon]|nr:MAG: hypothetical protein D6769_01440 [Euryarchaeota archaeon]
MDIPESGVLKVLGLLELLADYERIGVDDIRDLTGMEFNELEPIIDTASMLGLIKIEGHLLSLTTKGKHLVKKDPEDRKEYLARIVEQMPLFKEIKKCLRKEHYISIRDIEEMIESDVDEGDLKESIKHIIAWGSYAEILDYDHNNGMLRLR